MTSILARRAARIRPRPTRQPNNTCTTRTSSTTTTTTTTTPPSTPNIASLLSTPTWSITSLLPETTTTTTTTTITPHQLHHLLRLSALPPPPTPAAESHLLTTLSAHLHFVRALQRVDTTDVPPLRSLRDETARGAEEAEVGVEALRGALEGEEVRGVWHRRVRRRRTGKGGGREGEGEEGWDVLGNAGLRSGGSFVVRGGG